MTGIKGETSRSDVDRLASISTLAAGSLVGRGRAMCAAEAVAVAHLAGARPSDQPACASASIGAFVRTWNNGLLQSERDALILPLLPLLVGTNGSAELERRRVAMVTDWLVRTHLPAWFHLAKLNVEADELAGLPEIQDVAAIASLCDHLKHARRRVAVANLILRQTGSAVRAAAWDATHQAAWVTVRDELDIAGPSILAAGWDATYAAAYAATRAYGKASLEPTRRVLQQSALALVARMIEARGPDSVEGSRLPTEESPVGASIQNRANLQP